MDMEEEEDSPLMWVSYGEKVGRYLMYVFNTIFFIFGSFLFANGLRIHFEDDMGDYFGNLEYVNYYTATTILIVGGVIVMIGAVVALVGTYFWNRALIMTYVVLTLVSFSINLTGASLLLKAGLEGTFAKPFISETMLNHLWRYNMDTAAKLVVDVVQEQVGCCGGYSPSDWTNAHLPVPDTCRDQITGNQYKVSCGEELSRIMEVNTGILSGIALWICFLQLFTIIFVVCMYRGSMERRAAADEGGEEVPYEK